MSTRKTSVFYAVLIAIASVAVGMVIASRLDLTPASSAQTVAMPPMNSAPLAGAIDATTFRNIAKSQIPTVVNIRTESRQRTQDLTEFFGGGGGGGGEDLLRRFFGGGGQPPRAPRAPAGSAHAGSGHRVRHRQGGIHPHQQSRGGRGGQDHGLLRRRR